MLVRRRTTSVEARNNWACTLRRRPICRCAGVVIRPGVWLGKGKEVADGEGGPKIYRDFFLARLRGGGRIGGAQASVSDPHPGHLPSRDAVGTFLPAATLQPKRRLTPHAACLFQPRSRRQWMRHLASFFKHFNCLP